MNKVIDLFAGCGGMSLGFSNAGFDIEVAYDNWDDCVNVYEKNFDHPIFLENLREESLHKKIAEQHPDVIIGGPPCQDFSSAGKRKEDKRADLTVVFAQIVAKADPQYFVMENVRRIKKSNALKRAKEVFREAGYYWHETVLDASKCGVPQKRHRYFLIGSKNQGIQNIESLLKKNQTKERMTVHDFLGDSLGTQFFYRHPRSYSRRGIFSIHEPSPTIRGVNRPIPGTYKKHKNDKSSPEEARALTTKERSLIQTFPEEFRWEGTKTNLELMIGNAVPVKLAEFVAESLKSLILVTDGTEVKFGQNSFNFEGKESVAN